MKPQNKIPEQEYRERLTKLMTAILPKGTGTQTEIKELFRLHNDRLSPYESESGTICGGCVKRVFNKMKPYYENNYKNK